MRSNIPTRTSERIYAESYLDYKNDMFIFIEDIDENSRKIMLELIQRAIDRNIKIDRLHSCGNRKKVIEKFNERNLDREEIYIIDGDLNMLFENREFKKGLIILNKYCIENYLLDIEAIHKLLYEEACNVSDQEKLEKDFDYINWFNEQNKLLVNLFKIYAIEKYNDLGIETVSFPINALRSRKGKGILCSCNEELINERIEKLKTLIIDEIGQKKFDEDDAFILEKIDNKNADIIVSAKDYILPLIFDRLKKFANNFSAKNETLKFRIAKMINIKSFKENLEPHLRVG